MKSKIGFILRSISQMGFYFGFINVLKIWTNRTKSLYIPSCRVDIELRPNTSDIIVYKQVFLWNEYNIPIDFEPKVIIDGGGNIGLSAIYFASRFNQSKVYVLEPEEQNFKLLSRNTTNNSRIIPIESALWGSNISYKTNSSSGFWGVQIYEDLTDNSKSSITIKDLMERYDIDYIDILKLDIEGAEKEVFKGNVEWLKRVKIIVIELHDFMVSECAKTFFHAIENLNYSMDISGENIIIKNLDLR